MVFTRERELTRLSLTDANGVQHVSHTNLGPRASPRVDNISPSSFGGGDYMVSPQNVVLGRNLKTGSTWVTGPPGVVTGNTKKNQYEVFEESAWAIVFKDVQEKAKVCCLHVCIYVCMYDTYIRIDVFR